MFINEKEDKELLNDSQRESEKQTQKFMDDINTAFFVMLANPTDEQIKKFRDTRDALLIGWLAAMTGGSKKRYYEAAQIGIDQADAQLKKKKIEEIINKSIDKKTFTDKIDSRVESLSADLTAITESIRSNSEKVINEIKQKSVAGTIEEQKKISTSMVADLKEKGITFFTDKIGRKIPIETYIQMRVMTDTANTQRSSYFLRAIQYGVDLVRIIHLNLHPTCELCSPFENKILTINGMTPGYMTIDNAMLYGLFHPRCDHVPEELELAPEDKGGEGVVELNQKNMKRFDYNNKRTMI